MEVLVVLSVLVILAILWVSTRGKYSRGKVESLNTEVSGPEFTISVRTKYSSGSEIPDMGPVTPAENGGWVVNPQSTFPLTIYGIDRSTAEDLKRLLDSGYSLGTYDHARSLIPIIAKSNLHCKEIDQYIAKFKPVYFKKIEEQKRSSVEWPLVSEKDREDILTTFREEAIRTLEIQPYCKLETLFEGEPADITLDDALIERFGYENLQLYLRYDNSLGAVRVIPADRYESSGFEKLVELGLAIRGGDIPVPVILESLRLKDMNNMVADLIKKPFSRKAQAIQYLMSISDIKERISKVIAFRELFQLNPLPDEFSYIDLGQLSSTWRYANEIAILIAHTYVMSAAASHSRNRNTEDLTFIKGWELSTINDSATCPYCKSVEAKVYSKNKYPKVPLHIGCRCSVFPKLDL